MESGAWTEREVLEGGLATLSQRLPRTWSVQTQPPIPGDQLADIIIKAPDSESAALLLEVKTSVSAPEIDAMVNLWRRLRGGQRQASIVVIAPYLGPKVRDLLAKEDLSFVDLTGNLRISLERPGLFIEAVGARHDPKSAGRRAGIRGAKAGGVVRVLTDVMPPYAGADIARAGQVNEGYLSRILDTLMNEGLIERDRSGITRVDWPELLQRRAGVTDLFRPPGTHRYVARRGATALLEQLRQRPAAGDQPPTITGSFAAARIAPVAAPALLVAYTRDPRGLADELDLIPADAGADTVLIRPESDVAFARAQRENGVSWAAPSQVALDCLAGSGRMPAEGEAIIAWMRQNERAWRLPSIKALLAEMAPED